MLIFVFADLPAKPAILLIPPPKTNGCRLLIMMLVLMVVRSVLWFVHLGDNPHTGPDPHFRGWVLGVICMWEILGNK